MNAILPSRLLRWSIYTGLFFLLLMTVLRLLFFIIFKQLNLSFNSALPAFGLGLRFDLRIVCIWMMLLILLGSIPIIHPFRSKWMKKTWMWLSGLLCFCFCLLYIVDFIHYEYLSQRLNASVLNYVKDAGISTKMVWESYPVIKLSIGLIIAIVLMTWGIRFLYKKASTDRGIAKPARRWIYFTVAFLLFAVGIFGRIGQYPLRWSYAFSFGNESMANLSLNPFQSFFSTLKFRGSGFNLEKTKKYYPLMASQLGIQRPDSQRLDFGRSLPARDTFNGVKPNVVIVICESFSAYKSSMWGNPLNTTPYFNELCKNGIFFNHCFTPSWGTARGVWATVTGTPDVETPRTASRNMAMVSQHTIINDFKGYEKLYFIGGSTSWANIRGLLQNNIDNLHLYEGDDYKSPKIDVWGISDKNLFLEANGFLKKQTKPFIAVIQTADNHRPYTIPSEDESHFTKVNYPGDTLTRYGFETNAELNAFRYTDFCYQQFIEAARKETYFANTIFVFVGDHGIRGNAGNMFPKAWTDKAITNVHVPLLFYSPGLLKPELRTNICSQADILPSIAGLTGMPCLNSTLGRDLFDPSFYAGSSSERENAFVIDPDLRVIGIIDSEYYYRRSLISGKEDIVSIQNNQPVGNTSAELEKKRKLRDLADAWYESSYYLLFNNKKK